MLYSYIIPLYNEEGSISELYNKLKKVALALSSTHELIFIDDGSTDNSYTMLENLYKNDPHVLLIRLRQNSGKSVALNEGFLASKGDFVITLDADLQDDPSEIENLVKKLEEGYDVVSSWKKDRKDPLSKTLPSKIFNFIVKKFSGIPLHDFNSGLKAYKREAIESLDLYGELHRFIPVILANFGFKVTEIPVIHHERKYGVSKYGWSRIPKGFFDFITVLFLTKFAMHPLHLFGSIGIILTMLGFVFGAYLTILRFSGETIGGRPLLFLTMLLIVSGFQFVFTGLLAEMILHLAPQKKVINKQILKHDKN